MNKKEFLENLRNSLSNEVDDSVINNQLHYYDDYITSEVKKGKSETDVINELGDPRLIAKTIKQVSAPINNQSSNDGYTNNYDNNTNNNGYNNGNYYHTYNEYDDIKNSRKKPNGKFVYNSSSRLTCFIVVLIILIIIFSILNLLGNFVRGTIIFFGWPSIFIIGYILYLIFGSKR